MILPVVSNFYDPRREAERQRVLEEADSQNRKTQQDVAIGGNRLLLKSPDGALWSVVVDNAGALSAVAV